MPLVGTLLDAIAGLPNDTRQSLAEDAPRVFEAIAAIGEAIEQGGHDYADTRYGYQCKHCGKMMSDDDSTAAAHAIYERWCGA